VAEEEDAVIFYNFSGGMESAAMLVVERDRIVRDNASVRFADTGKQFPEMYDSIREIERKLGFRIYTIPPRITFDEFLFDKGGMIRKGTTDCSRRMKRTNLSRHMKTFRPPYEVNLGFNSEEDQWADDFVARNERDWLHWRFPLIEAGIDRDHSWRICAEAGFTILIGMYEKMGRFDCFWCGNQTPAQALRVNRHYPELAAEWKAAEKRKGHSFMPISLEVLTDDGLFRGVEGSTGCSCFGGADEFVEDVEE
jgi:hypothetical protein